MTADIKRLDNPEVFRANQRPAHTKRHANESLFTFIGVLLIAFFYARYL